MVKKLIVMTLSFFLLLSLAAGGGTGNPKTAQAGNSDTTQQGEASEETNEPASTEVHGINLTKYTDREFGYTMLCPDLYSDQQMYSDCWVAQDENYDPLLILAFSEYYPDENRFSADVAEKSDPTELLDGFLPTIQLIIRRKNGDFPGENLKSLQWTEMKVSGLSAAKFCAVLHDDASSDVGITGICVIGEKRPYVFWAADVSADQSYLDTAQAVLEACVANFKEGS